MKRIIGIDKRGRIRYRNSKKNKVMTNGMVTVPNGKLGKKKKRR